MLFQLMSHPILIKFYIKRTVRIPHSLFLNHGYFLEFVSVKETFARLIKQKRAKSAIHYSLYKSGAAVWVLHQNLSMLY